MIRLLQDNLHAIHCTKGRRRDSCKWHKMAVTRSGRNQKRRSHSGTPANVVVQPCLEEVRQWVPNPAWQEAPQDNAVVQGGLVHEQLQICTTLVFHERWRGGPGMASRVPAMAGQRLWPGIWNREKTGSLRVRNFWSFDCVWFRGFYSLYGAPKGSVCIYSFSFSFFLLSKLAYILVETFFLYIYFGTNIFCSAN